MAALWDRLAARPIAAKRLHRCRLRFTDDVQWRASVFPFFERSGEVQLLLIVRYDAPQLYATQLRPDWIQSSHPWSVKRAESASTELTPLSEGDTLEQLAQLWHFDPWWVLRETPFASHFATPVLKATNCVERLPAQTRSLVFDPSLSRVHGVVLQEGTGTVTRLWEAALLRERDAAPERDAALGAGILPVHGRWALAPIWLRGRRHR